MIYPRCDNGLQLSFCLNCSSEELSWIESMARMVCMEWIRACTREKSPLWRVDKNSLFENLGDGSSLDWFSCVVSIALVPCQDCVMGDNL